MSDSELHFRGVHRPPSRDGEARFAAVREHDGHVDNLSIRFLARDAREACGRSWHDDPARGWQEARRAGYRIRQVKIVVFK